MRTPNASTVGGSIEITFFSIGFVVRNFQIRYIGPNGKILHKVPNTVGGTGVGPQKHIHPSIGADVKILVFTRRIRTQCGGYSKVCGTG